MVVERTPLLEQRCGEWLAVQAVYQYGVVQVGMYVSVAEEDGIIAGGAQNVGNGTLLRHSFDE